MGVLKICQNWGDWRLIGGKVGTVVKHFHVLKTMSTSRAGSNKKTHICSSCEEVLVLTWLFCGGWYVTCYSRIFVLLYFVRKIVIDKIHAHENQRTVLQMFFSATGVLKKVWMYTILKFSKFLETCYREKLQ